MNLVNETPRRESDVLRSKVKSHIGVKSGKLKQGNQRPGFIEKLKVWRYGERGRSGMGELSEVGRAGVPQVRRWGSGGPGASHLHEIALKDGEVSQLVELPALKEALEPSRPACGTG